jgi:hypothetical protein
LEFKSIQYRFKTFIINAFLKRIVEYNEKKKNQKRNNNKSVAVDDFLKNEAKLRDLANLLGEQYLRKVFHFKVFKNNQASSK